MDANETMLRQIDSAMAGGKFDSNALFLANNTFSFHPKGVNVQCSEQLKWKISKAVAPLVPGDAELVHSVVKQFEHGGLRLPYLSDWLNTDKKFILKLHVNPGPGADTFLEKLMEKHALPEGSSVAFTIKVIDW